MDQTAQTQELEPQSSEEESQAPQEQEAQQPESKEELPKPEITEGEETPKDGAEAAPVPKPEAGHKRAGGYQRRIERLERQNQMLMDQLQRGGPAPAAKEKTAEEKAAEQFEQMVDRRIAERDAARETQNQMAGFAKRAAEARARHEDWDEAISELDIPTASPLGQAILTSDHGPELMYQLATNPSELSRLNAMPPFAAARELGKMEAKAAGLAPTATASPAKRPPAPPSPVTGSSAATSRELSTLPISEYKREQRKRLKR